jgi:hypothetical protein
MESESQLTSASAAPAAKTWRRQFIWSVVVLLYLATWIGGWRAHARDLETSAQNSYRRIQQWNAESHEAGEEEIYRLREGGPYNKVKWAVPILPGLLLVDSDEIHGPLLGEGGGKLVLYYGTDAKVLFNIWLWMS